MRGHRFTIYDALEKNGYFDANPANSFSRDLTTGASLFLGPVQYPKMLYHPEGEQRVTVPAEVIMTPLGAKSVGEQRELIWQIVANATEEEAALAEGWWDHPAKAVRKRVELYIAASPDLSPKERAKLLASIPSISVAITSQDRIKELERQIAEFEQQKAEGGEETAPAVAAAPPPPPSNSLQPTPAVSALATRFASTPPPA